MQTQSSSISQYAQDVLANALRLVNDMELLAAMGRVRTAGAIAVLASEEFGKYVREAGFRLIHKAHDSAPEKALYVGAAHDDKQMAIAMLIEQGLSPFIGMASQKLIGASYEDTMANLQESGLLALGEAIKTIREWSSGIDKATGKVSTKFNAVKNMDFTMTRSSQMQLIMIAPGRLNWCA